MAYKAMFILASALTLVTALPAEEQIEVIPVEIPVAQERSGSDLVASADASTAYGAPSSGGGGGGGYGGGGGDGGHGGGGGGGGHGGGGGGGGWGQSSGGGGWEAAPQQSSGGWGWEAPSKGWGWPKFKYLKFTIPIPILPRIKFGIKGGLKLNAAIQHPKGWGSSSSSGWRR